MNTTPPKPRIEPPLKTDIVTFTSTGPMIVIGGFTLRELADGSLWLENKLGEGMQVQAKIMETELNRLMENNF